MSPLQFIRSIITCLLIVITCYSCKKADANKASSITITTGSSTKNFNANVTNSKIASLGSTGFKFRARDFDGSNTFFEILLSTTNSAGIVPGAYSENAASDPRIELVYNSYFSLFGYTSTITYVTYKSPTNPVTINITAINGTSVNGTFSGVLKDITSSGGVLTLTNGEFYSKF